MGADLDTAQSWRLYIAAQLEDQATSIMCRYPSQSHYPDNELTSHCPTLYVPSARLVSARLGSDSFITRWFDLARIRTPDLSNRNPALFTFIRCVRYTRVIWVLFICFEIWGGCVVGIMNVFYVALCLRGQYRLFRLTPWNCNAYNYIYRQWPYIYIHRIGSTTIQLVHNPDHSTCLSGSLPQRSVQTTTIPRHWSSGDFSDQEYLYKNGINR